MSAQTLRQLGLVAHPTRPIDGALREVEEWAAAHAVAVGQVLAPGHARQVAEPIDPSACDLLLGIGGDGTALAALHAGAASSRPALGIACGSLGVLTSVTHEHAKWALDQFGEGRWNAAAVPGLEVSWGASQTAVAINDIAMMRDGPGQITVSITVDEVLYARVAGDGLVVATALGSSAYTMAVGGPLLAPGAEAIVVTPVAAHGGSSPPLVVGTGSRVESAVDVGHVGVRYELDGQRVSAADHWLTIEYRSGYATLVELADEEPRLAWLRRRGLVLDSPRVIAREAHSHEPR